ncbi:hypothetical protein WBG78_28830 [Chryseolinea sp. T2]|uniref:DUF6929 family protein n=1 Tax=Chryseolinea sp. T2 TaxID=3129255 RepID=UPI0030778E39
MNPTVQLLRLLLLADFPSGSSVNFIAEQLYLVGDDATHILVLDLQYNQRDSIHLFDNSSKRIPKHEKSDYEASTLLNSDTLLILGSSSTTKREQVAIIPLRDPASRSTHNTGDFINRIKASGISEINIEGVTLIGDDFVLANRGNNSNPHNHLIISSNAFWKNQRTAAISVRPITIPSTIKNFIGVSGLQYVSSNDVLLLTLSSENTSNAFDDGSIGNSYLGWIKNVSSKMKLNTLALDGLIDLSRAGQELSNQKIEGLCVESRDGDAYVVHLISDNDRGQTMLFKVKVVVP